MPVRQYETLAEISRRTNGDIITSGCEVYGETRKDLEIVGEREFIHWRASRS